MKTREEALEYGLSFPDTYKDAPFHDENWQLIRYKGNKKAFLWTYEREGYINLNVKVDPVKAYFWRRMYKSVIPGYHQNKDNWNTIILDGSIPDKDIKIVYTGLRPGEKLYEELIMAEEKEDMQVTYHNKIFVTKAVEHDSALFAKQLESLKYAAENKPMDVYRILKEILPNFNNAENISN